MPVLARYACGWYTGYDTDGALRRPDGRAVTAAVRRHAGKRGGRARL